MLHLHEQCQVSNHLRLLINQMKSDHEDGKENTDKGSVGGDNYVLTMKQIDYQKLELVADYLHRCNGTIPFKLRALSNNFYTNRNRNDNNNNNDNDN